MAIKEPSSMEEIVYFTNRNIGEGKVKLWVYRELCPNCKKGMMGKPVDKKGKVAIRAKHYECRECNFKMDKEEYEETLSAQAIYTCPQCKNEGEIEFPFKKKKVQGTDAVVFLCQKCNSKIIVTKKMKEI